MKERDKKMKNQNERAWNEKKEREIKKEKKERERKNKEKEEKEEEKEKKRTKNENRKYVCYNTLNIDDWTYWHLHLSIPLLKKRMNDYFRWSLCELNGI